MNEVVRTLAFCRSHDWGRDAYPTVLRGEHAIGGLVDGYTQREADGSVSYHEEHATIAATLEAAREFGNY